MRFVFLFLISLWSVVCHAKPAYDMSGSVVYVEDGDTITLLVDGRNQVKIRLSSIDAPESNHTKQVKGRVGQPYSEGSTKFLAGLIKGKTVMASCFEEDQFGRKICEIFLGGKSVNQAIVSAGWAWANTAEKGRFLRDKTLPQLESKARAAKLGLWQGHTTVEPWEWRRTCWKEGVCPQ